MPVLRFIRAERACYLIFMPQRAVSGNRSGLRKRQVFSGEAGVRFMVRDVFVVKDIANP